MKCFENYMIFLFHQNLKKQGTQSFSQSEIGFLTFYLTVNCQLYQLNGVKDRLRLVS